MDKKKKRKDLLSCYSRRAQRCFSYFLSPSFLNFIFSLPVPLCLYLCACLSPSLSPADTQINYSNVIFFAEA